MYVETGGLEEARANHVLNLYKFVVLSLSEDYVRSWNNDSNTFNFCMSQDPLKSDALNLQ